MLLLLGNSGASERLLPQDLKSSFRSRDEYYGGLAKVPPEGKLGKCEGCNEWGTDYKPGDCGHGDPKGCAGERTTIGNEDDPVHRGTLYFETINE